MVTEVTAPTTVVFDLGGVLIRWDPRVPFRTLLPDHEIDPFLVEIGFDEWNYQQDLGRTWADAVVEHSARFPHRAELIAAFAGRRDEALGDAYADTVDVLAELRAGGLRLLALTNWSAETFGTDRERYPFLDWFEGIVVSGEERIAKPDPRIFATLLQRYAVPPAAAVFVDDKRANVDAARAAGMAGIVHTDGTALRGELAALGLPVRAET